MQIVGEVLASPGSAGDDKIEIAVVQTACQLSFDFLTLNAIPFSRKEPVLDEFDESALRFDGKPLPRPGSTSVGLLGNLGFNTH